MSDSAACPVAQHVVVTGRGAPAELVAVADDVCLHTWRAHAGLFIDTNSAYL